MRMRLPVRDAATAISTAMLENMPSRRTLLRMASAGTLAVVAGNHLGSRARAQRRFPGRMRVLHASPDLSKVEVLFNDSKVLDGFQYGQVSDRFDLDPGLVRVIVRRDRLFINDRSSLSSCR